VNLFAIAETIPEQPAGAASPSEVVLDLCPAEPMPGDKKRAAVHKKRKLPSISSAGAVKKPGPVKAKPHVHATAPKSIKPEPNFPGAKPGECYVRVTTEKCGVKLVNRVVKPAYERIEVIPAVYETVKEQVLTKEASRKLEVIPAQYEVADEKVLLRPADKRTIEVPALYEKQSTQVLVRPAYSTWKIGADISPRKLDEKSGNVYCLVEIPAEYRTETHEVLVKPASTKIEEIPAEYLTANKMVLKKPETTRVIEIPAEYGEREVVKMVRPSEEKRIPVPAEYEQVKVRMPLDAADSWRQILCPNDATTQKITEIQKALMAAGVGPKKASGKLDAETIKALKAYQQAKSLPVDGKLNADTVKSLGVSLR
jgi:hypothetical protein